MTMAENNENENTKENTTMLYNMKSSITSGLEKFFLKYGETVARRPVLFILACVSLTGLCGLGLLRFRAENEGIKLWIPRNSDFRINNDWIFENFPRGLRFNSLILTSEDNILVPEVIQTMWRIRKGVAEIVNANNDTWDKMCIKRPVVGGFFRKRRRRQLEDEDVFSADWDEDEDDFFESQVDTDLGTSSSVLLYPQPYCSFVNLMSTTCFETSILELWAENGAYDESSENVIMQLTQDDILQKINNVSTSGLFLTETNFTDYLSGVDRDERGRIVSARATVMRWFGNMNMTAAKETGGVPGRGEPLDPRMLDFEGDLIQVLTDKTGYPPGLDSAPNVARSFGDIAGATILGDIGYFAIGYCMMFAYASVMMGRLSCVEHRVTLASAGIIGVVMGIIVSYGLCSAFGLFYGPMHSVMPFLMLGIGIDDMFVIMQSWDTLTAEEKNAGLVERFGLTMKHAGAAITVTSVTDVIAFGIGGLTVLPALQSFCIYASVGIVATFIFQSTFFLAWFSLDQRRLEAGRNACCCCVRHNNFQVSREERRSNLQRIFKWLGLAITKPVVKLIVILITAGICSVGIWGNVLLRQEFDPTWFLPQETYLAKWFRFNKEFFPSEGELGTIYFNEVDLPRDIPKIENLADVLRGQSAIESADSWTSGYVQYVVNNDLIGNSSSIEDITETLFRKTLTQYLFSPSGALFRGKFRFAEDLTCGENAPVIDLFEISFKHSLLDGPEEQIPAMNAVKEAIKLSNISGRVFPWAYGYAAWETDEVIAEEVYRNISLALLCVFLSTLLFIADLRGAVIIIFVVFITLVDVGGFLHFWGITIDTVSCNNLVIAIGLCVDYSVHVTHRFLNEPGSRGERVVATLQNIGPAVFNGGFSTFLAFILLAGSRSHVFSSFFKIFFLVVTFGLYHGLVFLPVLLSLLGPASLASSRSFAKTNTMLSQNTQL